MTLAKPYNTIPTCFCFFSKNLIIQKKNFLIWSNRSQDIANFSNRPIFAA